MNACADIIFTPINGIPWSTIFLERISPEVLYLRPPEKLVIEVKTKGRFREVQWNVNGFRISQSNVTFSNHNEIYFIEEISETNFGSYEISVLPSSIISQPIIPLYLDVFVISPGLQEIIMKLSAENQIFGLSHKCLVSHLP